MLFVSSSYHRVIMDSFCFSVCFLCLQCIIEFCLSVCFSVFNVSLSFHGKFCFSVCFLCLLRIKELSWSAMPFGMLQCIIDLSWTNVPSVCFLSLQWSIENGSWGYHEQLFFWYAFVFSMDHRVIMAKCAFWYAFLSSMDHRV